MYKKLKEKDLYVSGGLNQKDWPVRPCRQIIGQDRALKALNTGIQLKDKKTHLFCMGPKGVGRTSLTLNIIRQYAVNQKTPNDWIYTTNFDQPLYPKPYVLKTGTALSFSEQIDKLITYLQQNIPHTISGEKYQQNIKQIEQRFKDNYQKKLDEISQKINNENIAVIHTPDGLRLNPVLNGQILKPEAFNMLGIEIRAPIMKKMEQARQILLDELKNLPDETLERQKQIDDFKEQSLSKVIQDAFAPLIKKYKTESVEAFLKDAQNYLLKNLSSLIPPKSDNIWNLLRVHILTTNIPNSGMPVVHASSLNFVEMAGKIERTRNGLVESMIVEPGALHKANGGFLVIEIKDVLSSKNGWESLKQVLFNQKIRMNPPNEDRPHYMSGLTPLPIPADVKVILVGDVSLFQKLSEEEDFSALFKIPVCFEEKLPRTKENEKLYAGILIDFIQQNNLKPFSLEAINLLLGYASRLTQDQKFLTTHFSSVHNLMREADFIANGKTVQEKDIITAIQNQEDRTAIPKQNWLNDFERNLIQLDLSGHKIGQINGLAVTNGNHFSFGHPSKITCSVRLGSGKIEDVEREVTTGGHIHSKGIFILSAYLMSRYGKKEPFAMDATLVWEQLYNGIDGDSASAAQLCALMSAIGQIPLNQSIALTGSVNQFGQIQSVGAVNKKIEGYFDACQKIGLTGKQGVIIPEVCQYDLMLNEFVRQAVKKGLFHIYSVQTIDDIMEILSGLNPKETDKKIQDVWHTAYLKSQNKN